SAGAPRRRGRGLGRRRRRGRGRRGRRSRGSGRRAAPMIPAAIEAEVARLTKEGRHVAAARLRAREGAHAEASRLFAEVWEWTSAVGTAVDAGLLADAYAHAVSSRREADVARVLGLLYGAPEEA